MKIPIAIGTLLLATILSHPARAESLTDNIEGWLFYIHGEREGFEFSELRYEETDRVAGSGCLAYDAKGKSSPSLWVRLTLQKLPGMVDLTRQQSLAFSYKLTAHSDLISDSGSAIQAINMGVELSNAQSGANISSNDKLIPDGEWHEVVIPIEDFKSKESDLAKSEGWDRTDMTTISIIQSIGSAEQLDYTLKIANLHFVPIPEAKK